MYLFHNKKMSFNAGIPVRVYCKVGKAEQGKFALDVAVKTLGIYREYVHLFFLLFFFVPVIEFTRALCCGSALKEFTCAFQ